MEIFGEEKSSEVKEFVFMKRKRKSDLNYEGVIGEFNLS
jgi:hypothetical protein